MAISHMPTGYATVVITRPFTKGIPRGVPAGAVLAVSRGLRGLPATQWGLPGGGIERGESPLQAAVRETLEETGVMVLAARPIYRAAARGKPAGQFCTTFVATEVYFPPNTPRASHEGYARWQNWKTLASGPFGHHLLKVHKILKPTRR